MANNELRHPGSSPRQELVDQLRSRLRRQGAPKLQLLFIVCVAGTIGFLVSAAGLWLGLTSMTVRYALAAVSGYLAFLLLIRAWIAWQRGRWDADVDVEVLNLDFSHGVRANGNPDVRGRSQRWCRSVGPVDGRER
jgi:hypothetical protein